MHFDFNLVGLHRSVIRTSLDINKILELIAQFDSQNCTLYSVISIIKTYKNKILNRFLFLRNPNLFLIKSSQYENISRYENVSLLSLFIDQTFNYLNTKYREMIIGCCLFL